MIASLIGVLTLHWTMLISILNFLLMISGLLISLVDVQQARRSQTYVGCNFTYHHKDIWEQVYNYKYKSLCMDLNSFRQD